jgi:hypothetical protein
VWQKANHLLVFGLKLDSLQKIAHGSVLGLRLRDHVGQVNDAGLVRRGRRDPLDHVVAGARRELGRGAGRQVGLVDVVDDDVDAVLLAPFLRPRSYHVS